MNFRKRIQELLEEKRLRLIDLAEISEIPYTTLSRVMNNRIKSPGIVLLSQIATALNVPLTELFNDPNEREKPVCTLSIPEALFRNRKDFLVRIISSKRKGVDGNICKE